MDFKNVLVVSHPSVPINKFNIQTFLEDKKNDLKGKIHYVMGEVNSWTTVDDNSISIEFALKDNEELSHAQIIFKYNPGIHISIKTLFPENAIELYELINTWVTEQIKQNAQEIKEKVYLDIGKQCCE